MIIISRKGRPLFSSNSELNDVLLCLIFKYSRNLRYIGSTFRELKIHISEHRVVSYRTDAQLAHASYSRIRERAGSCRHAINEQGFSSKLRAQCNLDLRIAESLFIMKDKPELNGTEVANKLLIFT